MYDLVIVVPYRNRLEHLKQFVPALEKHFENKKIKIVIVEQTDEQPFNRGKLLNIGYDLCKQQSNFFTFHDVDMLPENVVYEAKPNEITHLAGEVSQFEYKLPYPDYLGGVIILSGELFEFLDGYNNDYWGWGIEDDDLNQRAKNKNIKINRIPGRFLSLDHEKSPPSAGNLRMWNNLKNIEHKNGLSTLQYQILEKKSLKNYLNQNINENHEIIKVDIGQPSIDWIRHDALLAFDPNSQGMHRAINTRSNCAILVPAAYFIDPNCETGLKELEKRGYFVKKCIGSIAIDKIRCQMAEDAFLAGFKETFWIDSDISFNPDDVDRVRAFDLPIVAGLYSKKSGLGRAGFSSKVKVPLIPCGNIGGIAELEFAATGFLFVKKEVYDSIKDNFKMPLCNEEFDEPLYPWFLPMVIENKGKPWYLSEDFAFSERAKQCGFPIYADTKIRLLHHGNYPYSWDEMAPKHKELPSILVKADFDATIKT